MEESSRGWRLLQYKLCPQRCEMIGRLVQKANLWLRFTASKTVCGWVKDVRQVLRGQGVEGFLSQKADLVGDP